jgi:hypothetical protein
VVLYQWTQRATCHSTSRRSAQAGPVRLIASVLNRPMVDSHKALSSPSPTVPIEPAIPAWRSSAVKATDTPNTPAWSPTPSLRQALQDRRRAEHAWTTAGLIHHSDAGSQYLVLERPFSGLAV